MDDITSQQKSYFLAPPQLQDLINCVLKAGYTCIGPQVRDGAIVYDHLERSEQLPWGISDEQKPGHYRLHSGPKHQAFAWANGPQGIKPLVFQPRESVWRVSRDEITGRLDFKAAPAAAKPTAILGARPCDLHALAIQDKVFLEGPYKDAHYAAYRSNLFLIAVNCTQSSDNCFCVSAGGYPRAQGRHDLAMTEIDEGFVLTSHSPQGQQLLKPLALSPATLKHCQQADRRITHAAKQQTKTLPFNNEQPLRDALFDNLEHDRWDNVAQRCLSCGNCTQVCPTCFCSATVQNPTLDGQQSELVREWDSCFTQGHSDVSKKILRDDTRKRYRQWLTHKLGSWHDQFGTSGCVGCGRCITWCPTGIDITEEAHALCEPNNS